MKTVQRLVSFLIFLGLIGASLFAPQTAVVLAQSATSQTCITKVGNPPSNEQPPGPLGCTGQLGPAGGNYFFPLSSVSIVTGIFTEMGSYAGDFVYEGHVEHAGLDIGTPDDQHGPVYAITDGVVTESGGSAAACAQKDDGCSVSVKHSTDTLLSRYTHVDPLVNVGDKVKRGQQIANVHVWITYNNDHLHLELHRQDNNYNINPRNYFPELEQFPPAPGYNGDVRKWSASRGILLEDKGGEWAEEFQNHPPCSYAGCWAL